MEEPWDQMTEREQERMRGLSEDLYAIEDGGAKQVPMSPGDRASWASDARTAFAAYQDGDCDSTLAFLRRPAPEGMPRHAVPFMQARCWERLGEPDVAVVFMKESERHDPEQADSVLYLLQKAGRTAEAEEYARRIVAEPQSRPVAVYLAAAVLLEPTRKMKSAEARPELERLVPVLRRALQSERAIPRGRREVPRTDAGIACMLGLCLERLGRSEEAVAVYNDALSDYPDDAELLTFRGLALYDSSRAAALDDFRRAARAEAPAVWPYFFLAVDDLAAANYHACWQWCLKGLERPAPREVHAQLHEWLGICRLMLGQPAGVILESFDRALRLDPESEQIRRNRSIAERHLVGDRPAPRLWEMTPKTSPRKGRFALHPAIRTQQELLTAQRDNRLAGMLAGVDR
jgi:tetratricopeptide (TPR) repeat protein